MQYQDIEQGSAAWMAIRAGKVTASRVADLIAKTKTGWGASRANYAAQLIAERLTGVVAESYTNAAMQHGTATEPEARSAYEFMTDRAVEEVAFVDHPTIAMTGASPDGMIASDGLVEFKCPNTATHIETLLGGSVPGRYSTQMQWQMACTGRAWCDFVSYDPRMPGDMRLFIRRERRDIAQIASLERDVRDFLAEIDTKVGALLSLYRDAPHEPAMSQLRASVENVA